MGPWLAVCRRRAMRSRAVRRLPTRCPAPVRRTVEPDRLSRELTDKPGAARMTAEALSHDAQLARDTASRWIRGITVPALASLRAAENVLSSQLGYVAGLSAAVGERRTADRRDRVAQRLGSAGPQRSAPGAVFPAVSAGPSLIGDAVIWLDDIDRLTGADGITGGSLQRLAAAGTVIMATIRAREYERYCAGQADLPG